MPRVAVCCGRIDAKYFRIPTGLLSARGTGGSLKIDDETAALIGYAAAYR
jgi:hypothetical protein